MSSKNQTKPHLKLEDTFAPVAGVLLGLGWVALVGLGFKRDPFHALFTLEGPEGTLCIMGWIVVGLVFTLTAIIPWMSARENGRYADNRG